MGDTGPLDTHAGGGEKPPAWWFARRPVLVAFALSVLAHALLLAALDGERRSEGLPGAERVLTAVIVQRQVAPAPPAAAPPAAEPTPAMVPAPPPEPLPQRAPPVLPAPPAPLPPAARVAAPTAAEPAAVEPAKAEAAPPEPAAAVERPPLPQPGTALAPAPLEFRPSEEVSQPPRPRAAPDLGGLGERLVARRLRVDVWVDEAGVVRRSQVDPYELKPQLAAQLEAALADVRFAPGLLDGQPVATLLRTRLCFDDAGALDVASPECWQPVLASEPAVAPAPAR